MNRILGWLLVCCCMHVGVRADQQPEVSIELFSDQTQFLPAEKLPIMVRIENHSGRTLKFGRDRTWLTFSVEEVRGGITARRGDPPVEGEFELENATRGKFRIDLAPYFELNKTGRYRISAQLHVPELGLIVNSPPWAIDVVAGSTVWSQTFGMPVKPGQSGGEVDRRIYILQNANYLKEVKLYFRVADAQKGNTYAVFPIGHVVSFGKPQPVIDNQARLHVLHQFGMRVYQYHIFSPDGEILKRWTYEIGESRPLLRMNDAGDVLVFGGVRRPDKTDLPVQTSDEVPSESPRPPAPSSGP